MRENILEVHISMNDLDIKFKLNYFRWTILWMGEDVYRGQGNLNRNVKLPKRG